jgi:dethiobiotin synthetase
LAAEKAGIELRLDDLVHAVEAAFSFGDIVVVESAGGALSPIAQDGLGLDLAERLGASVLVVGADALGVQSHALLVIEALRRRALNIAGVILSRRTDQSAEAELQENARMIRERGGVRVYATIPKLDGREKDRVLAAEAHLESHAIAEAILEAALRP